MTPKLVTVAPDLRQKTLAALRDGDVVEIGEPPSLPDLEPTLLHFVSTTSK